MLAKYSKPAACELCQLSTLGKGFATAVGPTDAELLFIGESLGYQEAMGGEPFLGAAGSMLDRIFRRAGVSRDHVKIHNIVNCQPPDNWLDGAPWEHSAITNCRPYIQTSLDNPHVKVVVTLGATPTKAILELWGQDGISQQDLHGTVHRDPTDRFWVVPTYHPSFLQRGATNLLDVVCFDVGRAASITRQGGYSRRPVSLLLDPPVEQFRSWVRGAIERVRSGLLTYIPVDIETPDSPGREENELTLDNVSSNIERVNFSSDYDEGLTVPYIGDYIPLIDEILNCGAILVMWFKKFDEPRLRLREHRFRTAAGEDVTILDAMWAAHHLQSDWPLGLGFWAPFYSDWGAWKHLSRIKGMEAQYGAIDGLQTNRVGPYGIFPALIKDGLWDTFWRHTHLREQYVLRPSYEVGVPVDSQRLDGFHEKLQGIAAAKLSAINESSLVGTLYPKNGYKKQPTGNPPKSVYGKAAEKGDQAKSDYIKKGVTLVQRPIEISVRVCSACQKSGVSATHNCLVPRRSRKAPQTPEEGSGEVPLAPPLADILRVQESRWFWQLPFNPDSPKQILKFIKDSGESPGRAKKSKKETTDKATIKKLAKKTGDPVYQHLLDYKAVKKVDSTYVMGSKRRLWADGRLHPEVTFRPSMFRDSSVNPNLQNVVADKSGPATLAAGFRDCIVADPGYRIVEIDYSGTEGIDTGWMAGDPVYIRLATLGVHAYLTSHILAEKNILSAPAELSWSDEDLAAFFKEIKKKYPADYDRAKRCVHGNNYGLTTYGMHETFPEDFPSLKDAEYTQGLYYALCPKLPAFHARVREIADDQGYLGGPPIDDYTLLTQTGKYHPFGYRHWFWGVQSMRPLTQSEYLRLQWIAKNKMKLERHPRVRIINRKPFEVKLGEDSKRVIALYPQSITAGKLKEAELALFHPASETYIGEIADGRTPLLHPIHDSLLLHMPDRMHEWAISIAIDVMRRPFPQMPCPPEWGIGSHIWTNVAVKVSPVGGSWAQCEEIKIPDMAHESASEPLYLPVDEEEIEDVQDLGARLLA